MAITTTATNFSNLNGLFKEVYADKLQDLQPKGLKLQQDFKFAVRDRVGSNYNQPVLLQHEHGFTYNKAGDSAFALAGNVTGATKNAQVTGYNLVLQSALTYDAASRAASGGKRAFLAATELLVTNMWESAKRRLEISLFYGQSGLGVVSSVSTANVVFTAASWAPGIWSGMEGAKIDFFDTTVAAGSTGRTNPLTISTVNISTKTVTFTASAAAAGVIAGDHAFFNTAHSAGSEHEDMAGLHAIMANTGTLFGISAASYSLWAGNTLSAGSTDLSFQTIQKAVALAVAKGQDEDMCLYIPSITWANVMTDQGALRRFTGTEGGMGTYEVGAESIKFWTQAGSVEVKPSIYCKEGFAYLLSPKNFMRIGSSDITFRLPDRGDEFFRHLDSHAGYELRAWSDQAAFTHAPGKTVLINNIVNS